MSGEPSPGLTQPYQPEAAPTPAVPHQAAQTTSSPLWSRAGQGEGHAPQGLPSPPPPGMTSDMHREDEGPGETRELLCQGAIALGREEADSHGRLVNWSRVAPERVEVLPEMADEARAGQGVRMRP